MSDLPSRGSLAPAETQLPVGWYFDERIFELEKKRLFDSGPNYVGSELMVPDVGDFHTLHAQNHARVLARHPGGVELLSNICRHRQAIMLEGRGNVPNIVCPLHRWAYDLRGEILGAPHFRDTPCLNLARTPLQSWNRLLFSGNRDIASELAGLETGPALDFSGYMYDRTEIHECAYNWKTFIEVYLEDYHVEAFHPGLGNFVACDDLHWQFGKRYSVQTVGVKNQLARAGSKTYERWQKAVLEYYRGEAPPQGAIWLTLYPNLMIEWYPHVLVVSTLIPRSPQHTTNIVEFYYPEDIVLFERDFVEAEQAAYMETAAEDDEIAIRMDRGRRALHERGENDAGPYQSPMEDGMVHFHEHIREGLGGPRP